MQPLPIFPCPFLELEVSAGERCEEQLLCVSASRARALGGKYPKPYVGVDLAVCYRATELQSAGR